MSDLKNTEDAIRQGKYLNAFLYFLIAAVVSVAAYFIVENRNLKKENRDLIASSQAREDRKEARCDSLINVATLPLREDLRALNIEYRDFRTQAMSDMREGNERSEILSSESRKIAKRFRAESQKTKQFSNQIDSVTEQLIK